MEENKTGGLWEWVIPIALFICFGWVIWHMPAFILDFIPPTEESLYSQIQALHERKDVSPGLGGLFGGFADIIDWFALVMIPVLFVLGIKTTRIYKIEYQQPTRFDFFSIFIGRVTMIMIAALTCVMLYEVFLRYALERPTLWANEMTLWIGGFMFLCSGLYGMQQRSHIRIFLLYDAVSRNWQRVFDTIWTLLLCIAVFFIIFGSYKQVFATKFYRWEMWGTAFDPPIPATVQPAVLIILVLVALQAVANLIADWNNVPEVHTAADDIDEDELEAIKRSVGAEK